VVSNEELLDAAGVSALIEAEYGQTVTPDTVTFYASQSRRKEAAGTRDTYDMPLPEEYRRVPRDKPGKGPRSVRRPFWAPAKIRAWRAAGRRPMPDVTVGRDRDAHGRLMPTAS
jgi:hypothetical protein